jgi:hypothetical protein
LWHDPAAGIGDPVLLRLDGDVLDLSEASAADQKQLIGLFVSPAAREGEWWAASGKL